MYSIEEKKKAVETYYQYGKRASSVIRDLGYPDRHTLMSWVKEYEETGTLIAERRGSTSPFTRDQMERAVNFYLSHGKNLKFTLESLGYPCRTTLKSWIDMLAPGERMVVVGRDYKKRYPEADRLELAAKLTNRTGSAKKVAEELNVCVSSTPNGQKNMSNLDKIIRA